MRKFSIFPNRPTQSASIVVDANSIGTVHNLDTRSRKCSVLFTSGEYY